MAKPLTKQELANVQRIVQNALEGISNPSFFGDEVHLLARHIAAQAEQIRALRHIVNQYAVHRGCRLTRIVGPWHGDDGPAECTCGLSKLLGNIAEEA